MAFLVPCSYLLSVTLLEKIKHPRPFKSLKKLQLDVSLLPTYFFPQWWHLFPDWGNPFNVSQGLCSLTFTAQMGSKIGSQKKKGFCFNPKNVGGWVALKSSFSCFQADLLLNWLNKSMQGTSQHSWSVIPKWGQQHRYSDWLVGQPADYRIFPSQR